MIHVRIDRLHPNSIDIFVNVDKESSTNDEQQHVYDRLFDQSSLKSVRQSTVVKTRKDSTTSSINRKNYTLEQILDNVQTIQDHYERFNKKQKNKSKFSNRSTLKNFKYFLKHFRTIKTVSHYDNQDKNEYQSDSIESSPFIFGGETCRWIAYPRDENEHIYENDFLS